MQELLSEWGRKQEEEANEVKRWDAHGVVEDTIELSEERNLTLNVDHHIEGCDGEDDNQSGEDSVTVSRVAYFDVGYNDYHSIDVSTSDPQIARLPVIIVGSWSTFERIEADDL